MSEAILAVNAGSSSIKFGLYDIGPDGLRPRLRGEVEDVRQGGRFIARASDGASLADERMDMGQAGAVRHMMEWVERHLGADRLAAAGHRIVHGGSEFTCPELLDGEKLERLRALTALAPLHQPRSLG